MTTDPLQHSSGARGITRPLAIWLALQCLPLALSATQTPLSDKFVRPAERLAVEQLLVMQVAASAMLFPVLLRSVAGTVGVIASTWPLLVLAGTLSADLGMGLVRAGIYLAAWLLVLAVWNWVLRTSAAQILGSAVASALALGGAALAYLQLEFDVMAVRGWADVMNFGPVCEAIASLGTAGRTSWRFMAYLMLLTAVMVLVRAMAGRWWSASGGKWRMGA